MTIRPAVEQDIPAIVKLLKVSLGESLMPKSESFWRWKHIDNPFGKSPVLLAFEGETLIGVRAFMRWEWRYEDKVYKAVRAVDTATHPNHQGKGIFKKLTLQLVDQCKSDGVDFIFNTPNTSSKPGYLKMGWMSNGKMKVYVRPVFSLRKTATDFEAAYGVDNKRKFFSYAFQDSDSPTMRTELTEKFLYWRYGSNPNIQYYAFSDSSNASYLIFFRLKPNKFGLEFRICDCIQKKSINPDTYKDHLMQVVKASGANLITSSSDIQVFPSVALSIGPEITTLPLSFEHNFLTFNFWKPSLGDMEVF